MDRNATDSVQEGQMPLRSSSPSMLSGYTTAANSIERPAPALGLESGSRMASENSTQQRNEDDQAKRLESLEKQLRDAQELIARLQVQQQQLRGDGSSTNSAPPAGVKDAVTAAPRGGVGDISTGRQSPAVLGEVASQNGGVPETHKHIVTATEPVRPGSPAALPGTTLATPPPVARKPDHIKIKRASDSPRQSPTTADNITLPEGSPLTSSLLSAHDPPASPKPPPPPPRRGSVLTPIDNFPSAIPGSPKAKSPLSGGMKGSDLPSPITPTTKPCSTMGNTSSKTTMKQPQAVAENQSHPAASKAQGVSLSSPTGNVQCVGTLDNVSSPRGEQAGTEMSQSTTVVGHGTLRASGEVMPRRKREVLTSTSGSSGVVPVRSVSQSSSTGSDVGSKRFSGALELAELELLCSDTNDGTQGRSSSVTPVPCHQYDHEVSYNCSPSRTPSRQSQHDTEDKVASSRQEAPSATRQRSSSFPENSGVKTDRYVNLSGNVDEAKRLEETRSSQPCVALAQSYQQAKRNVSLPNVTECQREDLQKAVCAPSTVTSGRDSGETLEAAVRLAAEEGQLACLKVLLAQGSPDKGAKPGHEYARALHLAASGGHQRCLEELLNSGADLYSTDRTGCTALETVSRLGHQSSVDVIVHRLGASQQDHEMAEKALRLAKKTGHSGCESILASFLSGPSMSDVLSPVSPLKAASILSPSSTDSALVADAESSDLSPARNATSAEPGSAVEVFLRFPSATTGQGFGNDARSSISLGTVRIFPSMTWSQLEMDVWKNLDRHLSALCQPFPSLVTAESLPLTPAAKSVSDQAMKSATLKSITSWSSSITGDSGSYNSNAGVQLPTSSQLRVATIYASDLGLGVDSVKMYSSGEKSWRPDMLTPHGDQDSSDSSSSSPYDFFGEGEDLAISLKGVSDGRLDQLAYQSLIPVNTLTAYLDKFRSQGKVLFSGPPACGKSEIATALARCLQSSLKADGHKVDLLHCPLRGNDGEGDRVLSMLHKTGMLVVDDFSISQQSLPTGRPQRHCIIVVESSSAMAIQNGLGELLSCFHGDQTLWIDEGVLPAGLYRLAGPVHLLVILDTTGPIGLDPRNWHRFFHIRWRWDTEPMGGQLQRHLQRQYCLGGGRKKTAETTGNSGHTTHDFMLWVNDVWQRINKLFTYLGYNQLILGPSVFFSCPVHQHDNPNEIARWLADLWNNQLAPCIEVVTVEYDNVSSRQMQRTSIRLLLVTIRLALLPGCPLQGNDLAQWLESLHCGMDTEEINEMVQEIRDTVISSSSEAISLADEDLSPTAPTPAKASTNGDVKEASSLSALEQGGDDEDEPELAKISASPETSPFQRDTRPTTPSFLQRLKIRGSGRFPKRNSVAPDSTPQQQKQPKEQKPATRKAEEEDFFTQLTKMQGDRIDDQRVSAPACMFMTRPQPEAIPASPLSHKAAKSEKKKASKKASNVQSNDGFFTLGRHRKSSRNRDYENIFPDETRHEPATRSASADDFLNAAESDDNVFCSSTNSVSPDMTAIHLPPNVSGTSSLRMSSARRRSMSELMRLTSDKDDAPKEGSSSRRHKSLSKMKSTQSMGRGSKQQHHHRSASHVNSLSIVPQEGSRKVTPAVSLGDNVFPFNIPQTTSTLPTKRSQITYM